MIRRIVRSYRLCFLALIPLTVGLIPTSQALAQRKQLFTAVQQPTAQLTANQQKALTRLQAGKGLSFIKLVRVDTGRIGQQNVDLDLAPGVRLLATKGLVTRKAANKLLWTAPLAGKGDRVTMVVRGGNVTGTISSASGVYQVRPLGGGLHALVRLDPKKMPAEHPSSIARAQWKPPQGEVLPFELTPVRPLRYTTIRLLVAYTPAAAAAVPDVEALIDLAVAETNQSYEDSQVHVRLTLVDEYQVSYTESGDFFVDLNRFRATGDGFMDDVHTHRSNHCADIAVLLLDNSSYCGLSSAQMATSSTAFAAVHYDCATGYYSFGHEIGHLQGAGGDDPNPTSAQCDYAHAYSHPPNFRTIMASDCPGGCPRFPIWSNPNLSLFGFPAGTACRSDNHRVLNETAATVAAFMSTVPCHRIEWPRYRSLLSLCALTGCGARIRGVEEHVNPSSEFTRALQQGGATAAQAARLRAQAGALFLRADGASAAQIVQIEKEAATLEAQFNQLLKIKKVAPAKRPTD